MMTQHQREQYRAWSARAQPHIDARVDMQHSAQASHCAHATHNHLRWPHSRLPWPATAPARCHGALDHKPGSTGWPVSPALTKRGGTGRKGGVGWGRQGQRRARGRGWGRGGGRETLHHDIGHDSIPQEHSTSSTTTASAVTSQRVKGTSATHQGRGVQQFSTIFLHQHSYPR
jgi:hypothetical protein